MHKVVPAVGLCSMSVNGGILIMKKLKITICFFKDVKKVNAAHRFCTHKNTYLFSISLSIFNEENKLFIPISKVYIEA